VYYEKIIFTEIILKANQDPISDLKRLLFSILFVSIAILTFTYYLIFFYNICVVIMLGLGRGFLIRYL